MAEKCRHGRNLITEFKTQFHMLKKTKKALFLAYGLMFFFLFFTVFIAINLSSNYSSFWFSKVSCIDASSNHTTKTLLVLSNDYKHRFSSLFSHFKSNTSARIHKNHNITVNSSASNSCDSTNRTFETEARNKTSHIVNSTYPQNADLEDDKVDILKHDHVENGSGNVEKRTEEKGSSVKNQTVYLAKKHSKGTERDDLIKSLMKCDLYDGDWVIDETYPLYKPGFCSLIDEQFNCFINGRPDNIYEKLRWKPKSCTLPRLNGSHMLELLTGKRLVFVGDSLNRNMWESLICILKNSVKDQNKVYEASGKVYCKTEVSYSYVFQDYNSTVEFYVSPFLVQEWETKKKNGEKKETLRLDTMGKSADSYKDADILIFNTGHWWTHEKTSLGKDYYQEGKRVHRELNVLEAFRRALTTWGKWLDANIYATKSLVLFRGYSVSHFSGGQWNSGGACDNETDPIRNEAYLSKYPDKMTVLESVFKGMKTKVSYMNVTRMTDYRKDGHPSVYRKKNLTEEERRLSLSVQDCSHWCLPGVPDLWNEILYAELFLNEYNKQQRSRDRL